jgi:hypothetical protein
MGTRAILDLLVEMGIQASPVLLEIREAQAQRVGWVSLDLLEVLDCQGLVDFQDWMDSWVFLVLEEGTEFLEFQDKRAVLAPLDFQVWMDQEVIQGSWDLLDKKELSDVLGILV